MTKKKSEASLKSCACIIPFYNEGDRILRVLSALTQIKQLNHIVCVDDGSKDKAYLQVQKKFPKVTLIRSDVNHGKAAAIKKGLSVVDQDYVLLVDADIENLVVDEVRQAISYILSDESIDMLIFKRKNEMWASKLIRGEVLFSGERVLKTGDLRSVFSKQPKKFQIEAAINVYMMDKHKTVYWVVSSGKSVPKIKKSGLVKGILRDIEMSRSIITYASYKTHLKSILTFCTNEYKREEIPYDRAEQFFNNPYASMLIKKFFETPDDKF